MTVRRDKIVLVNKYIRLSKIGWVTALFQDTYIILLLGPGEIAMQQAFFGDTSEAEPIL